jgi:hypothetical protein
LEEVKYLLKSLVVLLVLILLSASIYAHEITLEAEDYTSSFNTGGESIYVTACSGASGGYAVEGFDSPGEWIEITLTTPELGAYADTLRSAGLYGYESDMRITIMNGAEGGGDIQSYYDPIGLGIG